MRPQEESPRGALVQDEGGPTLARAPGGGQADTEGTIHSGTTAADGERVSAGRLFSVGSPGGHAVCRRERKCDGEEPPAPLREAPEGWCRGSSWAAAGGQRCCCVCSPGQSEQGGSGTVMSRKVATVARTHLDIADRTKSALGTDAWPRKVHLHPSDQKKPRVGTHGAEAAATLKYPPLLYLLDHFLDPESTEGWNGQVPGKKAPPVLSHKNSQLFTW